MYIKFVNCNWSCYWFKKFVGKLGYRARRVVTAPELFTQAIAYLASVTHQMWSV